jgi:hypothetical protein
MEDAKNGNPFPALPAPSSRQRAPPVAPAAAPAGPATEQQTAQLVAQVRDVLPDLGEGFVEACLRHFGLSAERTIAALCDNALPPHLAQVPSPIFSPVSRLMTRAAVGPQAPTLRARARARARTRGSGRPMAEEGGGRGLGLSAGAAAERVRGRRVRHHPR